VDAWCVTADFDGVLRDLVHAFKYDGRRSLGAPLGRWMAQAAVDVLAGADCVVPVPLHPWKRLTRGFNQARDLAAQLGPPVVTAVARLRYAPAQVGLSSAARRRSVAGVFRPSPMLGARRHDRHVRGRTVVLVDDVRTTGATIQECALVLKQMGAAKVRAVVLAQAALARSLGQ
jgi:ComF family protein